MTLWPPILRHCGGVARYEDERGDWLQVIAAQEELTNWQGRLAEQIVGSWQIIDLSDKSSYFRQNTIPIWHKYEINCTQIQNTNIFIWLKTCPTKKNSSNVTQISNRLTQIWCLQNTNLYIFYIHTESRLLTIITGLSDESSICSIYWRKLFAWKYNSSMTQIGNNLNTNTILTY